MIGTYIFNLLVFPGLIFTAISGLIVGWVDRKLSARIQFRKGPPFFQNFYDIIKLLGKETILIKDSIKSLFVLSPIIAFGTLILISTLIEVPLFFNRGFGGDILVIMYLLMIYPIMVIFGGASTGNVYSSIGSGREIKLLLADELVFILICLIPIVKSGYKISLEEILATQNAGGAFIGSISGVIAFIIGLISIQAKMALPPFHISEAETEIAGGPFMEYSGPLLAFWKLNQYMVYIIYPFFLIALFLGGFNLKGFGILWAVLKYFAILLIIIVIKNTNLRFRIDTAISFFWKYATSLILIGLILSVFGV